MDLEEDVKKTGNWKPQVIFGYKIKIVVLWLYFLNYQNLFKTLNISALQIDVYKRQISELHSKLEAENNRADKSDFETKRLLEKAEALSVERDRLQAERDTLKTANADLQDQVPDSNVIFINVLRNDVYNCYMYKLRNTSTVKNCISGKTWSRRCYRFRRFS